MRRTGRRRKKPVKKGIRYRMNEHIRVPEVQLIDEEGKIHGVVPTADALKMAKERELDLVEVSPKQTPPVAKILDYGQFLYQQEKQRHKQQAKVKKVSVKGIRISFRISDHDLEMKKRQAAKFLSKGNKVKLEMILRGRERQHKALAVDKVKNFINDLREQFLIVEEQELSAKGNRLTAVIGSKGAKEKQSEKEED